MTQRLQILSQKYDALLEAKERAEKKYKEDYKKWKAFKVWLFDRNKKEAPHEVKEEEPPDAPLRADPLGDSTNVLSARTTPTKSSKSPEYDKIRTVHTKKEETNIDITASIHPSSRTSSRCASENTPPHDQLGEFVQGSSKSPSKASHHSPEGAKILPPSRYSKAKPV